MIQMTINFDGHYCPGCNRFGAWKYDKCCVCRAEEARQVTSTTRQARPCTVCGDTGRWIRETCSKCSKSLRPPTPRKLEYQRIYHRE